MSRTNSPLGPHMIPIEDGAPASLFTTIGFHASPFPFVLQISAIFLVFLSMELNLSLVLRNSSQVYYQEVSGLSSIGCFIGVFLGFLRGSYRRLLLGQGKPDPSIVLTLGIILFILFLVAVVFYILQNFSILTALMILAALVPTTIATTGLLLKHGGFLFFSAFIITAFFLLRPIPIQELDLLLLFSMVFLAFIEVGSSSIRYGELTEDLDTREQRARAQQQSLLFKYFLNLCIILSLTTLATTLVFGMTDIYRDLVSLQISESIELSSVYAHLLVALTIIGIGVLLMLIKRWRVSDAQHDSITSVNEVGGFQNPR